MKEIISFVFLVAALLLFGAALGWQAGGMYWKEKGRNEAYREIILDVTKLEDVRLG